jgi:hypothetical protein
MESDTGSVSASATSSEEMDPTLIEEAADELLGLMDGVVADMALIETKVETVQEEIFKRPVSPLPGVMRTFWNKLNLPPAMEFDEVLERVFQSAERLDTQQRVIHFTDEFAPIFGKSSMGLYELVDILIDSLKFSNGRQAP